MTNGLSGTHYHHVRVQGIQSNEYVLPAIQREFVWNAVQIERLFDSLMRGYPIGSFLFWKIKRENVEQFQYYQFMEHYHERDFRHNAPIELVGDKDITAILDGQQRLTSSNIGLRGWYAYKLPYYRWDSDHAFPKRCLYLNLLHQPHADDEFYQEKSQDLEKVLNIFIRVNSGGTELSYSDMLLSIATAQWKEKDARQEIDALIDALNLRGEGFRFTKDFVLKACLVLADVVGIQFKVSNFTSAVMLRIEEEWEKISRSLHLVTALLARWGYSWQTLPSNNAVIPIVSRTGCSTTG